MMDGEGSQGGVEGLITKRQRFRHCPRCLTAPGSPLGDHRKRRFNSDHPAVCWFIVSRTGAHVYDAHGITQGSEDQPLDTRIRPAGRRVTGADGLVDLISKIRSQLFGLKGLLRPAAASQKVPLVRYPKSRTLSTVSWPCQPRCATRRISARMAPFSRAGLLRFPR